MSKQSGAGKQPAKFEGTLEERLVTALRQTWQVIGLDMTAALGHELAQDEIRDCVADYLDTYGGLDRDDYKVFWHMPAKQQDALLLKAFPD